MKTIYFMGECMIELKPIEQALMQQSFAGDVYNSAVYLKRSFPHINSSMVTAVGVDAMSDKMLQVFAQESLDIQFVFRHPEKVPGLYLIATDESGERSFTYWRNDSAARKIQHFLVPETVRQLASGDMFFLSGISLAVIEESARGAFWRTLEGLKRAGVRIVFDPNYRARLWRDKEQTRKQYDSAFRLADVVLPGLEDLSELYGFDSTAQVLRFCQDYDIAEIIIKNGPESVVSWCDGRHGEHQVTPVEQVIDTTSAGDAFNGVYLGARLSGITLDSAVQLAAVAAGTVIQHPGAIAPKNAFINAMQEAGLIPA
ncbi:sugar kinase [Planctobacterium marinum]|uniref:2-dehydro-3-deoxygluconokinase n=1 Tax=Planctobacterium marinum TaxID=1631968 RepID=A0AA48KTJ2_9ALTE|nr:2-dehydro-3-deoxygluconokinase [Planctobacterium marinum]